MLAGRLPTLAAATVPLAMFEPFKFVYDAPEPLKVVAVTTPVILAPPNPVIWKVVFTRLELL